MATEVLELQVRVSGNAGVSSAFRGIKTDAAAANAAVVDLTSSLRFMRSALVALSFARAFEGLETGVTAAQSIVNLLTTVTANQKDANAAFDYFFQLAQKTRAPFEEISQLAVNISRTIADGPNKLQQTADVTRNIAESFAIAGANGQTVRNVTRDIIEMFNGGAVIMRQFRAILQQDRPLLDAIAQTVQATGPGADKFNAILDKAKKNGTLSGGTLTEALTNVKGALQGSDVQKALSGDTQITTLFERTTETLGQSLTKLNNQWIAFLQHINEATNSLNFLAGAVDYVANHIPEIILFGVAIAGLLVINTVLKAFVNFGSLVGAIFNALLAPVRLLTNAVIGLVAPFIDLGVAIVRGLFNLPSLIATAVESMLSFSQVVAGAVSGIIAFAAELPITIINGLTVALTAAGEAAGFTVAAISKAAETSVFTVSTALEDLESVFSSIVIAAGSVTDAFIGIGAAAAANIGEIAVNAVGALLSTLLELIPAFAAIVIAGGAFATIGVAIYGLIQPLAQVGTAVGDLGISFSNILAVVVSTFTVIINNFPLFTSAMKALWQDMLNSMENSLGNFGNETLHFFADPLGLAQKLGLGDVLNRGTAAFKTDRQTDSATPILNNIVGKIKAGLPAAQAQVDKILGPFQKQIFALINGTGPGEGEGKTKKNNGYDSALASLDQLIAKIDPAAAATARLAEVQKTFNKAAKEGIDVDAELAKFDLTRSDVYKREIRDVVGAGNAATDYAGKIKILQQALNSAAISQDEFTRLARAAEEALLKTKFDVGSGVQLGLLEEQDRALDRASVAAKAVNAAFAQTDAARDYATTVDALNSVLQKNPALQDDVNRALLEAHIAYLQTKQDFASGFELGVLQHVQQQSNEAKIAADALNNAFANQDALQKYQVGLRAINQALAENKISADDASQSINKLQQGFLGTQRDALSGFQDGLLKAQDSLNNFAQTASQTVTQAFDDLTDSLTKFFTTGKLDFQQLGTDVLNGLTKLAVQQVFTGPLANALGFGQNGQGGLFGSGGLLGTIFGGTGLAGAAGGQLGSSGNPMYVRFADGTISNGTGIAQLFNGGSGPQGSGSIFDAIFGGSSANDNSPTQLADGLRGALDVGGQQVSTGIQQAFQSSQGGGGFLSSLESLFSGGGSGGGGILSSLFSGASSIFSGLGSLLGFAGGGSFVVGGTTSATDQQLVAFRASKGEKVSIETPGQQKRNMDRTVDAQSPAPNIAIHLHGVTDFDSFKKSKSQLAAGAAAVTQRAYRRNGGG